MLKVVVANERTKKGLGTKNGERERRATRTTEEGKWPQRVRTKGNGRRAALAKTG